VDSASVIDGQKEWPPTLVSGPQTRRREYMGRLDAAIFA
jgi:hypothetical protein